MSAEFAICITARDADKLRDLLHQAQRGAYRHSPYVQMLAGELARAIIVDESAVPPDVITMHAQARLIDADTGEEMLYTLVYPDEADPMQGKISVLAPIGTAMLGYRVGDEFRWDTPDGLRRLRVVQVVFQPEAANS